MLNIMAVTVARSDYGIYKPIFKRLQSDPEIELSLLVTGMHLSPEFGLTVKAIEDDGFHIAGRVEMLLSSDTPEGISKSIGLGIIGISQVLTSSRPDLIIVLGDRFEMYAAAVATLPFNIPLAHIHGGEVTEGAIDDAIRHSITKLSHMHFVSTQVYRNRVIQLGESPWRVVCSGAPALDMVSDIDYLSASELEARVGLVFNELPILVTYHSVTTEYESVKYQVDELLATLKRLAPSPIIFTMPNADTGGRAIITQIKAFNQIYKNSCLVDNLGTRAYFSLLKTSRFMIGNSSSGLIEAPTFKLPVINIGNRQKGRIRGVNVIDVGYKSEEIEAGIQVIATNKFQDDLADSSNPYGTGNASQLIVNHLKKMVANPQIMKKSFHDLNVSLDLCS